LFIKKL